VHGTPTTEVRNGFVLSGSHLAVVDSTIVDIRRAGEESHGILVLQGPGPFDVRNNDIEAAAIGILFGGFYPQYDVSGHGPFTDGRLIVLPSDVTVARNYVRSNLAWCCGRGYGLKNNFEIKMGQRVLVENNVFRYTATDGQTGQSIVFKSAGYGPDCPHCVSQDVTFRHNLVADVCGTFSFITQNRARAAPTRFHVHDNIITKAGSTTNPHCLGTNVDVEISGERGAIDLTVDHNTWASKVTRAGKFLSLDCSASTSGPPAVLSDRITVTNNISVAGGPPAPTAYMYTTAAAGTPNLGPSIPGIAGVYRCLGSGPESVDLSHNVVGGYDSWYRSPAIPCTGPSGWFPAASRTECPSGREPTDFIMYVARPTGGGASADAMSVPSLPYCLPPGSPYRDRSTRRTELGADCVAVSKGIRGVSPLY
jgi:hypothetical protein